MGGMMADTKRSTDPVVPAEVTELIDESQKIQGWIDKLAELQDETTPAVYEKVHTDYKVRLGAVTSRLSEHRSDLNRALDERRPGAEALRAELDERAAELEEAKLRFAVGEYVSEEWDEQRGSIEGQLESLKDRLSTEDAGLEELETVLGSIPDGDGDLSAEELATVAAGWQAKLQTEDVAASEEETEPPPAAEEPEVVDAELEAAEAELEAAEAELDEAELDEAEPEAVEPSVAESGVAEESPREGGSAKSEDGEYLDELEFLESLSLAESDRFDAVSAMLEEEEGGKGSSE
jgi:chromosome segregation ATPase